MKSDYVKIFEDTACKQTYEMAKGVEAVVKQARIDLLIGLREAIQPDGLINSKEGTRTIESITKSINSIIDSESAIT